MGAHLALTQEDEDRNLGAVPKQICSMMSAGADAGLENRGQQRCCGDRHLRPAPYAQMLELVDRPASDTGAHRACGSDSRSVHLYTFLAQLVEQRSFKP